MIKLIEGYRKANKKTKNFILTCIIYGLALIVPIVYCYVRLDFVRSGVKNDQVSNNHSLQIKDR